MVLAICEMTGTQDNPIGLLTLAGGDMTNRQKNPSYVAVSLSIDLLTVEHKQDIMEAQNNVKGG